MKLSKILSESQFSKVAFTFITFLVFKSITFIAPLGVSSAYKSLKLYGEFEYVLNLGQMLMGLFSMGFAGTYAYFVFKENRQSLKPIFHFHFILISVVLFLLVLINPSILSNSIFAAILVGAAMADQVFLSAVLKLKGKNNISIIVDSGLYIAMGFLVLLHISGILIFSIEIWNITILTLLISTVFFIHKREVLGILTIKITEIKLIYAFGGMIFIAGPLLVLINASTRLYIEHFLPIEDVGIYSYLFRISSITLIFSRVFVILMYRRIFISDHKTMDSFYSKMIYFILLISLIIFFILPYFLKFFLPLFEKIYSDNQSIFILCIFQIIFWITTSLFEPILQRENKVRLFIISLIFCNTLMLGLTFGYSEFIALQLSSIVKINCLVIFILVLFQINILWRNNHKYILSLFAHLFVGFIFLFLLFIL